MSYVAMDARPVDLFYANMKIRKICLAAPKNLARDCTVCVWGGLIHLGGTFQIPLAA